jgi:hypothetical protein
MWRIRPFHTECPVSGARSGADRLVCCHISNSAGRTIRSRTAMPIWAGCDGEPAVVLARRYVRTAAVGHCTRTTPAVRVPTAEQGRDGCSREQALGPSLLRGDRAVEPAVADTGSKAIPRLTLKPPGGQRSRRVRAGAPPITGIRRFRVFPAHTVAAAPDGDMTGRKAQDAVTSVEPGLQSPGRRHTKSSRPGTARGVAAYGR